MLILYKHVYQMARRKMSLSWDHAKVEWVKKIPRAIPEHSAASLDVQPSRQITIYPLAHHTSIDNRSSPTDIEYS